MTTAAVRPMPLSVVIPARNEAGNIGPTLDGLRTRLGREGIPYELLVVDDGSTDTTVAEVEARSHIDPGVRLVSNPGPNGFGRAIRFGLSCYQGDAVVIAMADGSDDPEDVVAYYYVLRDVADCAFGSRFMAGGRTVDYPRVKLVINRLANVFIRVLFRVRYNDVTNAFKGYRREVVDGCQPLISPHFNLTVELPLKAIVRGYSHHVVPIGWSNRKIGSSSLRLEEQGSRYLFIVLYVWLEAMLTKGDYRRRVGERFQPWEQATAATLGAAGGLVTAGSDLARLYASRFPESERAAKAQLWRTLCEAFFSRYVPPGSTVLDVGAGYCDLINHLKATRRIAIDLNPDTPRWAAPGVEVHGVGLDRLGEVVAPDSVDVAFASNVFEHLRSPEMLLGVLRAVRGTLRPGGKLIILQPNVRLLGGRFWDFVDHTLPLTERGMVEALETTGFRVLECRARFLPYTTKSRLPQAAWMVRLYLAIRPAQWLLGGQMLVVAERTDGES